MCERGLDNGRGSSFSLNRPSIGCFAKSFHQNGLLLRTEPLSKSFINNSNKQMHALICSGSESGSVCAAAEWLDLLWLKILNMKKEKASFILFERHFHS